MVFAVNTARAVSTHSGQEYSVLIDVNGDQAVDDAIIGGDEGIELGDAPNGRFVSLTVDWQTLTILDAYSSEAPLNGSVVYLRTTASSLGTTAASAPWNLFVDSASQLIPSAAADDAPNQGWLVYAPFHPVSSLGVATPRELASGASLSLPFSVDPSAAYQSHRGLLVVAPDNPSGTRTAMVVTAGGL